MNISLLRTKTMTFSGLRFLLHSVRLFKLRFIKFEECINRSRNCEYNSTL